MKQANKDFLDGDDEISNLKIGATAFTVSWAFSIDDRDQWWVRGDYSYSTEQGGTVKVKMTRKEGHIEVVADTIDIRSIGGGKPRDAWYPMEVELV